MKRYLKGILNNKDFPVVLNGPEKNPFIPPEDLLKYKEADPALPKRIMALIEKEAEHRRALENKIVDKTFHSAILNQIFGILGVTVVSVLVVIFVYRNFAKEGMYVAVAVMTTIASIFVIKRPRPVIPVAGPKKMTINSDEQEEGDAD